MFKFFLKSLAIFFFFLPIILIALPSNVTAANLSYLVTTGVPSMGNEPNLFFSKNLVINYLSGNIILSSTPDGIGETIVDDAILITVTRPDGSVMQFGHVYPPFCGAIVRSLPPRDITELFLPGANNVLVQLSDVCGGRVFSSPIYLVNTGGSPAPFLDLPWDYQGKGLSFNEAALAINSYFDHEYPLLSSGVIEPQPARENLTSFRGEFGTRLEYSSHDGYDYGKRAKADIGDSVIAAAAGCASYTSSPTGGNVIKIDHGNNYQTRYLHLQSTGLITTDTSSCVNVSRDQMIGKVGATGNVIPQGELGAHIHFMVIEDKNHNGNFDDNIPDGVTDPFGWQSQDADPWSSFAFSFGGQARTGNTSFYLWERAINNLSDLLTANGGFYELERYKLNFPQGVTNQNLTIEMQSEPIQKPSNFLESIGTTVKVTATDFFGNVVNSFQDFFTITIDFSGFDISGYRPETLSIYSSEDGINWQREETEINFVEKTASARVNHLSFFALMAEPLDTTAPTTTAILSGIEGEPGYFRSSVQVTLDAIDNENGSGLDYTLYKINEEDWQEYSQPFDLIFNTQYNIQFYSADKFGNIEEIKGIILTVDKSAPDIGVNFDLEKEEFVYTTYDVNNSQILAIENLDKKRQKITAQDSAGNITDLIVKDKEKGSQAKINLESFSFNQGPIVDVSKNKLVVDVKRGKDNEIESMSQKWQENEVVKVRVEYNGKTNKSEIFVKFQGQEKLSDVVDGLVKLGVRTIFGTINYTLM